MSNIEEDYKLFQMVKRNPINNCIDLSKNMIGKRSGVFYFTELFRIDFENRMCDLERLKTEREADKKRIKELEEALLKVKDKNIKLFINSKNSIPVQKVKDKMEKLNKEIKNGDVTEAIFKIKQQQILAELLEDK